MFQKKRRAFIINLNLEFVITMNLIRKKEIWARHAKSRTYEWYLSAAGQPPGRCYWFFFVINLEHKLSFLFLVLEKFSCKIGSTHLQSITTFVGNELLKNEEHYFISGTVRTTNFEFYVVSLYMFIKLFPLLIKVWICAATTRHVFSIKARNRNWFLILPRRLCRKSKFSWLRSNSLEINSKEQITTYFDCYFLQRKIKQRYICPR